MPTVEEVGWAFGSPPEFDLRTVQLVANCCWYFKSVCLEDHIWHMQSLHCVTKFCTQYRSYVTVYSGPCEEDGSRVWEWEVYNSRHPISNRIVGIGVEMVIKGRALEKKCRLHKQGNRSPAHQPPCVPVEKRWCVVLFIIIFGFQLFDYWSDIILFKLFNLPI